MNRNLIIPSSDQAIRRGPLASLLNQGPPALLIAALLLHLGNTPARGHTYSVPSSYATITAAVAALPTSPTEPDTILVSAGTYLEQVTVNDKHRTASYPLVIRASGS